MSTKEERFITVFGIDPAKPDSEFTSFAEFHRLTVERIAKTFKVPEHLIHFEKSVFPDEIIVSRKEEPRSFLYDLPTEELEPTNTSKRVIKAMHSRQAMRLREPQQTIIMSRFNLPQGVKWVWGLQNY